MRDLGTFFAFKRISVQHSKHREQVYSAHYCNLKHAFNFTGFIYDVKRESSNVIIPANPADYKIYVNRRYFEYGECLATENLQKE